MNNQSILNISWGTIFKILVGVVCVYILYLVKDVIVWFIFALIIGILFNFLIDILEKKRVPRIVSAIGLYFIIFALLSFLIYQTAPVLLRECREFSKNLSLYLARISPLFEKFGIQAFKSTEALMKTIQANLERAGGNIFNALFSIFGGAAATVLVLALAFFISLEKQLVEKLLAAFSPQKYKEYLFNLWGRAKRKVSGWFISRIIGVIFVGSGTYLVLRILGVEYAFILSLMAGFLDFVPIIGPIIAGTFITLLVALTSPLQAVFALVAFPLQAVFALVAFIIIQILENNLLFPVLFKKFVGLPPALVLVALAIGGKLWGVVGAILAIPLAGVLFELLKDYLAKIKNRTSEA